MSIALSWLVSPTSEVSNGTRFFESTRKENRILYSFRPVNSIFNRNSQKNMDKFIYMNINSRYSRFENEGKLSVIAEEINSSLEQKVYDSVMKQAALLKRQLKSSTSLMNPERQRAFWAIYVWSRRTDELVDGPNASHITPMALDRWEARLEDIFRGRPFDMLDAALSDTVTKFPVDIQPFRNMIEGMKMDLWKSRYKNFDELYLYCYYVAGTVGLMSVPIMGIAPESQATTESVYNAVLAFGVANQLTNILRDVGEDARRGRIYLPQDELAQAGLSEEDIFAGKVTDKWRIFMKNQIKRARKYFDDAEKGIPELSSASRWPVWASLLIYRQILDEIEANDCNNFTKKAYVSKPKKNLALPMAYAKSIVPSSSRASFPIVYGLSMSPLVYLTQSTLKSSFDY